jgi:hypothetical protein
VLLLPSRKFTYWKRRDYTIFSFLIEKSREENSFFFLNSQKKIPIKSLNVTFIILSWMNSTDQAFSIPLGIGVPLS